MIDNADRILVVILAGALAVLLVLAIITVIKLIQLINTIKRIADKAEHAAEAAEAISAALPKAFGSFAVGRALSRFIQSMMKKSAKKKRGK